jgi:hypothetical protein
MAADGPDSAFGTEAYTLRSAVKNLIAITLPPAVGHLKCAKGGLRSFMKGLCPAFHNSVILKDKHGECRTSTATTGISTSTKSCDSFVLVPIRGRVGIPEIDLL